MRRTADITGIGRNTEEDDMSANKVIVIDGNLVERAELTEILEKSGYEILGAATGSEGGKLIAAHLAETAAIFLRLDLPDIPGNVILRELNHKGITLKVPVTIIEGEEDEETPDEIFEMGVIDFARRPFRSKMVQRRLKNAIRICRIQGYPSIFEYKRRDPDIPDLLAVIKDRTAVTEPGKLAHITDILTYVYVLKFVLPSFDLLMNIITVWTGGHSIDLDHFVPPIFPS